MKYALVFLLGVACGAAALVFVSCIVVGKMADEDQLLLRYIERQNKPAVKVETNMYDQEETFPNCTVQVLTNTMTGETSVGWWKNVDKC